MGKLLRRIHHRVNRRRLERELDDEMSAHHEMMPPERRGAFGNTLRRCATRAGISGVGSGSTTFGRT